MKKTIFRIVAAGNGRIILLMVVPKSTVKRVAVILNLKKIRKIGDFMGKMKLIRQSMNGNVFFPGSPVSVANGGQFDADTQSLENAETTALTRARGAATARDVAKGVVLNDAHLLQGYVQGIADANPAKALQIVQSSGFEMKVVTPHSKGDFTVRNTKLSGTMKLAVNVKKVTGGSKRASFKWQMSTDNATWTELPSTLKGSTTASGRTPGTIYFFRFLVILKNGESSWSMPVSLMAM